MSEAEHFVLLPSSSYSVECPLVTVLRGHSINGSSADSRGEGRRCLPSETFRFAAIAPGLIAADLQPD